MKFDVEKEYIKEIGKGKNCAQDQILMYLNSLENSSWDKKQQGIYASSTGFSDFVGHINGEIGYIEVKSKTGKPSMKQIEFIKQKKLSGAKAGFAASIKDAIDIMSGGFGREFPKFGWTKDKWEEFIKWRGDKYDTKK